MTIEADDIGESATYNWYNLAGELFYSSNQLQIDHSNISDKYILEVMASADGCKDYKEFDIDKNALVAIKKIFTNPASTICTFDLSMPKEYTTAYLQVTHPVFGNISNYVIDPENDESKDISVENYTSGIYVVSLIVNGEIIDYKNLQISS